MYQNKELTIEQNTWLNIARNIVSSALSIGVILTSTHVAAIGSSHADTQASDLKAKAIKELHTHSDIKLQGNRVVVDPKSLRSVRSEGDKLADLDRDRSYWDVYTS